MILERRRFIGQVCKSALTVVGGYVVAISSAHAAEEEDEGGIGPI